MTHVLVRYHEMIARGELRADPDQAAAARRLDDLQTALEAVPVRGSVLWRMLRKPPEPVRGLYMYGGVGRGKSMLMDLFHDCLTGVTKRREAGAMRLNCGGGETSIPRGR